MNLFPTDVHQFAEAAQGDKCYYCHRPYGGLIHDVQPGDTPEQVQAAQKLYYALQGRQEA
jgi:hypothetical protein